jgi:hypothetical protein
MTASGRVRQTDLGSDARALVDSARAQQALAAHVSTMSGYHCAPEAGAALLRLAHRLGQGHREACSRRLPEP